MWLRNGNWPHHARTELTLLDFILWFLTPKYKYMCIYTHTYIHIYIYIYILLWNTCMYKLLCNVDFSTLSYCIFMAQEFLLENEMRFIVYGLILGVDLFLGTVHGLVSYIWNGEEKKSIWKCGGSKKNFSRRLLRDLNYTKSNKKEFYTHKHTHIHI